MLAILKILLSATLIWIVNEVVVKHSKPLIGSLIASLPLVSLITFVWIYYDLRAKPEEAVAKLAAHSTGIFWFVLPTLPMFLLFPMLLRRGLGFWPSLLLASASAAILYYFTMKLVNR